MSYERKGRENITSGKDFDEDYDRNRSVVDCVPNSVLETDTGVNFHAFRSRWRNGPDGR